ncbi:MAG TPA: hypothetical protein VH040_16420 [Usitatibacter sp.]|nr:hypothetical protein [Usitatibacter sp.]
MPLRQPFECHADLTDDRLRTGAEALLETRYSTLREMNSPFDDNYTRESAIFGRQRNRIIDMALQTQPDWLTLAHAGMDLTFMIGSVPCRYFTEDNSESPKKDGFFKRNATDNLFAIDDQEPVFWRFVIERNPVEATGDRAFLIGYNSYQEPVAMWEYKAARPVLHSVDHDTPRAVEIPPARVEAIESEDENEKKSSASDAKGA